MSKLRIVPVDDTIQSANVLEYTILRRFGFDRQIDKKGTSLWFLDLNGYNWTMEDANFMEKHANNDNGNIAGWNYQD